jgi:hypothetical protein
MKNPKGAAILMFLMAAMAILVAVGLTISGLNIRNYIQTTPQTHGVVVDKNIASLISRRSSSYLSVEFIRDGTPVRFRLTVNRSTVQNTNVGDTVPIWYTSGTNKVHTEGQGGWVGAVPPYFFAVLLVIGGIVIIRKQ